MPVPRGARDVVVEQLTVVTCYRRHFDVRDNHVSGCRTGCVVLLGLRVYTQFVRQRPERMTSNRRRQLSAEEYTVMNVAALM